MALLSASLLTLTARSSLRLKRRRYRTTEAPPRPSGRRGRISERRQRPELTTLPLQSRPNASPFWIMLLLSVGALEHGVIKQIAAPLQSTRLESGGQEFESLRARQLLSPNGAGGQRGQANSRDNKDLAMKTMHRVMTIRTHILPR